MLGETPKGFQAAESGIRGLRQLRGRVSRTELVFGQRSAKLFGRTGYLREWCGGRGKETERGRGVAVGEEVEVSSEKECVLDHPRVTKT